MKYVRKLPEVEELIRDFPLEKKDKQKREKVIGQLQKILSGDDARKIIIVGPCSADREDAVIEYVSRLCKLQEKVKEVFLIVPRVYTSKPRTNGMGYKGLLHRPNAEDGHDNILSGVIATREMHQRVIKSTGMFAADEMLYPEILSYISDLLAYVAVGARSVENQQHRLVASGLEIPVGMKNPTSGNKNVMLNAILAAQNRQSFIYRGWEVKSEGNIYAHSILRGYMDAAGKARPNYYYEDILELYDGYYKMNLANPSVIIDCNHSNSNKHYDEQQRISEEIFSMCRRKKEIRKFIKGVMIESYLVDGAQLVGGGIYGKSITDACLGWEKTEKLILKLAEMM